VTEGVSENADVTVGPGTTDYTRLQDLPEFVSAAAYLSEEVAFWRDGVLNLHLMERAVRMNLEERRFVYGGSTITQQLVKNLFLSRDKTLARKLREALIGWRMLDVISKERVLELYLNCIEFGPDIYGIERAAQHYFQRSADKLTLEQAVFLAIIKPAPWYGERFRQRGSTPKQHWWRERMGEIIARLVIHDVITRDTANQARPFVVHWNDDGTWKETPHRDSEEPSFESTLADADPPDDSDDNSDSDRARDSSDQKSSNVDP
jgi:membrane peptidoglycan carboxypeptidase